MALAGVMGGLDTEVTDATVNILLEAATFEAGRTSARRRDLSLISDASIRYERGVDDHGIAWMSPTALIAEVSLAPWWRSTAASRSDGYVDVFEPVRLHRQHPPPAP